MTRRRVSNPLALAVLSCLSERPMHPYEISTTLRTRGKEESIKLNYGSLYSVVESLRKHGLIRALETSRQGRRPERTVYEITEAGAAEHDDWLAELLSSPVREFTSLEAGLSLMAGLGPDEVARLLEERADRLRFELRGLDATHAGGDRERPAGAVPRRGQVPPDAARRGAGVRRATGDGDPHRGASGHRHMARAARRDLPTGAGTPAGRNNTRAGSDPRRTRTIGPGSRSRESYDRITYPGGRAREVLRGRPRARRPVAGDRRRQRVRAARAQRRRQVDHRQDPLHALAPRLGERAGGGLRRPARARAGARRDRPRGAEGVQRPAGHRAGEPRAGGADPGHAARAAARATSCWSASSCPTASPRRSRAGWRASWTSRSG